MEIPAPVLAFLAALPEGADNCSVSFGGVVVSISRPNMRLKTSGLDAWLPTAEESSHFAGIDRLGVQTQGKALGLTADELARAAARRPTDVASLSQQMPVFEEDPLATETETDRLTDRARAEFAAATAPKGEV
jgi:hypothetical protein